LAFGFHLNIVCVAAQVLLIRDQLMDESANIKLLRTLPDINANAIISLTCHLIRLIPEELYKEIVVHATKQKKAIRKFATMPRNWLKKKNEDDEEEEMPLPKERKPPLNLSRLEKKISGRRREKTTF